MKNNIKRTILGVAVALAATGANAADISLTPAVNNVLVGDTFALTVEGSGFTDDVSSGSVTIGWDPTLVMLDSSAADITASAASNGFPVSFAPPTIGAGTLSATYATFLTVPGPTFDFFSLSFTALATGSGQALISAGPGGDWQSGLGTVVTIDSYNGASINVNEVPLPAAVWLFGTGLLGLAGVARRRNQGSA